LDEAKLDQKAGNNQGFFGYLHNSVMTEQDRHNWPDFFCRVTFLRSWVGSSQGAFRPQRLLIFDIGDLKFRDLAK